MNESVHSYLTSGLAVITACSIITAPTEPQHASAATEGPPIAVAAQVRPLQFPVPTTLALPSQLPRLLGQQVSFNAGVAIDFIVTGAQLIGRQLEVFGTLVGDIRNGTPVPVAVGRAVVSLTNIELDAGRELVGFGRELADFQIQFVGNLVSGLPPIVAAPAGQALVLSAGAVDAFSDFANGVLDDLSQTSAGVAVARSQSDPGPTMTESAGQTSLRPDNIVTLRRDKPKSTAVERDSTTTTKSRAGDSEHGVTHKLGDAVRRNVSTSVSNTADESNGGEHQQRHRRDRQQDNSGDAHAKHGKAEH
jgi:hypothetical protein